MKSEIRQVFAHYEKWEDFKAGMFSLQHFENENQLIDSALKLLSDNDDFYNTLLLVINNWEISTAVNLTNKGQNRKAWLGAAGCCYKYGVPEYLTRIAWNQLDEKTQHKANLVAEKIINHYLNTNTNAKTLFE